jgi:hypothetical protein
VFWQFSKGFQTLGSHLTPMLGDNGLLERQIGIRMKFSKEQKKVLVYIGSLKESPILVYIILNYL